MLKNFLFLAVASAAMHALLAAPPASAADLPPVVARWYDALRAADRDVFEALLAPQAEISLKYLGIVQSRDEFIESLDAWEDVARSAEITTKAQSADASSAIVEVCYRFPSNERLNRETFALAGDTVTAMTQEEIAESCDGF